MKKIIILPFLILGYFSWGQSQFVVQNGAKTEVYTNINTAITNAAAGDTLYLPGGGFSITNATIDKTLHWVGQGYYPDSTTATMPTRITSALTFTGNCDNSSFEGIFFTSTIYFGSSTDETENVKLKRCRVMGELRLRNHNTDTPDINFQITECVLKDIAGYNASNCLVEKSLLFGRILDMAQSSFKHNSINVNDYYNSFVYGSNSCTFTNNIFGNDHSVRSTTSCTFINNTFQGGLPYTPTDANGNGGSNNIYNVGSANIYSDISHSTNIYTFSYNNDYHLNTTSTGTRESDGTTGISIIGTASDSTNAGIYGTTTPYKTIPYYPHINTATIATEATNDQLGVDINVQAQSR